LDLSSGAMFNFVSKFALVVFQPRHSIPLDKVKETTMATIRTETRPTPRPSPRKRETDAWVPTSFERILIAIATYFVPPHWSQKARGGKGGWVYSVHPITHIVLHTRPHYDEILALWILLASPMGEKMYPGIRTARMVYVDDPNNVDWKVELIRGRLCIGCGGGPLDEHGKPNQQSICAAALAAYHVNMHGNSVIVEMVKYAIKADRTIHVRPEEIPEVVKRHHRFMKPADVIRETMAGLAIRYQDLRLQHQVRRELKLTTRTVTLAQHQDKVALQVAVIPANAPGVETPYPMRVARERHDLIIARNTTPDGRPQVGVFLARPRFEIKLDELYRRMLEIEAEKQGLNDTKKMSLEALQAEVPGCVYIQSHPAIHYGNQQSARNVGGTQITDSELFQAIQDCVNVVWIDRRNGPGQDRVRAMVLELGEKTGLSQNDLDKSLMLVDRIFHDQTGWDRLHKPAPTTTTKPAAVSLPKAKPVPKKQTTVNPRDAVRLAYQAVTNYLPLSEAAQTQVSAAITKAILEGEEAADNNELVRRACGAVRKCLELPDPQLIETCRRINMAIFPPPKREEARKPVAPTVNPVAKLGEVVRENGTKPRNGHKPTSPSVPPRDFSKDRDLSTPPPKAKTGDLPEPEPVEVEVPFDPNEKNRREVERALLQIEVTTEQLIWMRELERRGKDRERTRRLFNRLIQRALAPTPAPPASPATETEVELPFDPQANEITIAVIKQKIEEGNLTLEQLEALKARENDRGEGATGRKGANAIFDAAIAVKQGEVDKKEEK
jgi:hypothetical protein